MIAPEHFTQHVTVPNKLFFEGANRSVVLRPQIAGQRRDHHFRLQKAGIYRRCFKVTSWRDGAGHADTDNRHEAGQSYATDCASELRDPNNIR